MYICILSACITMTSRGASNLRREEREVVLTQTEFGGL